MLPRVQPLCLITLDSSSGGSSSPRAAFRAPVEYSSTLLRLGQLDDGRCDDHLPCCQSDEDSNANQVDEQIVGVRFVSTVGLAVGES